MGKAQRSFIASILCLWLIACSQVPSTPTTVSTTATSIPSQIFTATPTTFPSSTPTAVWTATSTPELPIIQQDPSSSLAPYGPWILYLHNDLHNYGKDLLLTLINTDGSGSRQLRLANVPRGAKPSVYISSDGQMAALVMEVFSDIHVSDLYNLYILELPLLKIKAEFSLYSTQAKQKIIDNLNTRSVDMDYVPLTISSISFSWSPDSQHAVFTASPETDTSALFLYNRENNGIQRLPAPPNPVLAENWSPDSQRFFLTCGNEISPSSGRMIITSFGVMNLAGEMQRLSIPQHKENLIGWYGTSMPLFEGPISNFEDRNYLRMIDLKRGISWDVFTGTFSHAAIDPETGQILIAKYLFDGLPPEYEGVYMKYMNGELSQNLMAPGAQWWIQYWSKEDKKFYLINSNNQQITTIDREGKQGPLIQEPEGYSSPDKSFSIRYDRYDSYIYDKNDRPIAGPFDDFPIPRWLPDSKGFIGVGCSDSYYQVTLYLHLATNNWQGQVVESDLLDCDNSVYIVQPD